ncbi:hypothetical protein [Methylobacterium sp. sgz302541]|uniref:hypothetical protein n=1 Tax=unclassified Methylobacterium TaxID=2615210 RepID=UPI003D356D8D
MPVESWIAPDDAPAMAAAASEMIDAVLANRGALTQAVFWSTIRKAYNTPYNPPPPRKRPQPAPVALPDAVAVVVDDTPPLPIAAMAMAVQAGQIESHAG